MLSTYISKLCHQQPISRIVPNNHHLNFHLHLSIFQQWNQFKWGVKRCLKINGIQLSGNVSDIFATRPKWLGIFGTFCVDICGCICNVSTSGEKCYRSRSMSLSWCFFLNKRATVPRVIWCVRILLTVASFGSVVLMSLRTQSITLLQIAQLYSLACELFWRLDRFSRNERLAIKINLRKKTLLLWGSTVFGRKILWSLRGIL